MGSESIPEAPSSTSPGGGAVCDDAAAADNTSSIVVDKVFLHLSDDEKEKAARASSYRYLATSSSSSSGSPAAKEEEGQEGRRTDRRDEYARAMIERYVIAERKLHAGGNKSLMPDAWEEAALTKLRRTLEYREEKRIDAIRQCFDEDKRGDGDGDDDGDGDIHATMRERFAEHFSAKKDVVRGYTRDGRAMYQCFPRDHVSWEEEYYIKGNIYMLERALACTERLTDGGKDKVVVLFDYAGYGMRNSPPVALVRTLLFDLRDHWPERMEHVFVVDAPFVFRAFWAIIKHFIDPITKDLVQFVTGKKQKEAIFRELISEDHAAPYMYDGGRDGEETDMESFFYGTPHDHAFGEERSS